MPWHILVAGIGLGDGCTALPAGTIDGDGCGDGFIDPDRAHAIIDTFALAFAQRELWGVTEHDGLLDGRESLDDAATVSTH